MLWNVRHAKPPNLELLFRIDESRERFLIQKFNSEAQAHNYL